MQPTRITLPAALFTLGLGALSCSGDNLTTVSTGTLNVTVTFSGAPPAGFLRVDAQPTLPLTGEAFRAVELAAGDHQVEVGGMSPDCRVTGENPRTVTVESGGATSIVFEVTCEVDRENPNPQSIAFVKNGPGVLAVFLVNPDGTGLRKLADGLWPIWSQDHTKLAFFSGKGISAVNADGSGLVDLTAALPHELHGRITPTGKRWSPDGRTLAFEVDASPLGDFGGPTDIWLVDSDGGNSRRLVENGTAVSWSPDGSRLAYQSPESGDQEIYVISTDGSNRIRLTNSPNMDQSPEWSPDGSRILYQSWGEIGGPYDLAVMNSDGTGRFILSGAAGATGQVWLQGGRKIGFETNGHGAMMNADGTGVIALPEGYAFAWSPDGTEAAFVRNVPTGALVDPELYVVKVDGTGLHNVSNSPDLYDLQPAW